MSELNFSTQFVDIVQIKAYCKNCGRELKCSNNVLCSYPPQYEYYCGRCNEEYTSTEKCPRIDYVPKKKGRWIYIQDCDSWECSECKDAFVLFEGTPKDNNYNHCPNCGAKMEGESNDKATSN